MSNKKLGNDFEATFCQMLSENGFWVHNLAQNAAGQPADVIAVKNGKPYLIDCKVCSNGKFDQRRIEENQNLAMAMWVLCGNGQGWFALKLYQGIFMARYDSLLRFRKLKMVMNTEDIMHNGIPFDEWIERW